MPSNDNATTAYCRRRAGETPPDRAARTKWRSAAGPAARAVLGGLLLASPVALPAQAEALEDQALLRAKKLLEEMILVDGHNDLPWAIRTDRQAPGDLDAYDLRQPTRGQTDLERLRQGRVGAQFWSVYVPSPGAPGSIRTQLEQIDLAQRIIARYPEALRFASSVEEIRAAHRAGRIASLLGMEGGHTIESSLGVLRAYYALGVRYMGLVHGTHNDWADSATQVPPRHDGLAPFGEAVVREMNRLGMLVDLSHASDETMRDALRVSKAPVIFSHSSARALVNTPRNVPDEILRLLPDNGGVVMVAFVTLFVDAEAARIAEPAYREYLLRSQQATSDAERERLAREMAERTKLPPVPLSRVADHIEHIRDVAGIAHVGIGADYDGASMWPERLQDVSGYPHLFAELIRRGWTDEHLRMLAGENLLRAMARAERVARELQQTTAPSTAELSN